VTILILTHGGAEELITRLAAEPGLRVAGVCLETEITRPRPLHERVRRSVRYDGWRTTVAKLGRALLSPARHAGHDTAAADSSLEAWAARHQIPVHRVTRFEAPESLAMMATADPDLGITWGTNILKPQVFQLPRLGTLNLHQGLTPYYRGGPSAFWELFDGESCGGVTVHFVAADVDAGDIVLQESVPLTYDYDTYGIDFEAFLRDYRARLRERGLDALVDAVRRIASGTATRRPQDTTQGRRYRLPTHAQKQEMRRRLRRRRVATRQTRQVPARVEPR
jgi:folate-dependent phosphoribosylglycinamide formyltransferase PurN